MAVFDWNRNGSKNDIFDHFMDYQAYKDFANRMNNKSSADEISNVFGIFHGSNESDDFDDYDDDEAFQHYLDDTYGTEEENELELDDPVSYDYEEKIDFDEMFKNLCNVRKTLNDTYEMFTESSEFRINGGASPQLIKDFWLYSIAIHLENIVISLELKIKLLQVLLDEFEIDNSMTAKEYYQALDGNDEYKEYIKTNFECTTSRCSLFWVYVLGINDSGLEEQILTATFNSGYAQFMRYLDLYLSNSYEMKNNSYIETYLDTIGSAFEEADKDFDDLIKARYNERVLNPLQEFLDNKPINEEKKHIFTNPEIGEFKSKQDNLTNNLSNKNIPLTGHAALKKHIEDVRSNDQLSRMWIKMVLFKKEYQFVENTSSAQELLINLIKQQKELFNDYEDIMLKSEFRDKFSLDKQMHLDFWLYTLAMIIDYSNLNLDEKTQLLQTLLDVFSINNPMTAEEYYSNMSFNSTFKKYLQNCFLFDSKRCGLFWVIFIMISFPDDDYEYKRTINYIKRYTRLVSDLETYLSLVFIHRGFGIKSRNDIVALIEACVEVTNYTWTSMEGYNDNIYNPSYHGEEC